MAGLRMLSRLRARSLARAGAPALGVLALAGLARADAGHERPTLPAVAAPAPRPELSLFLGFGGSRDPEGVTAGDSLQRAFFVAAGIDARSWGLSLRTFSTGPRLGDAQRSALEALAVLRPLGHLRPEDRRWGLRLARSFSIKAGPAVEEVVFRLKAAWRLGVGFGAHVDAPVVATGAGSELRIRIGARRMVGQVAALPDRRIGDSKLEIYAALGLAF